jgi:hypothetical protein
MPNYIGLSDTQISALTALLALISGLGLMGLGWLLARCAGELGKPTHYDYEPGLEDYYGRDPYWTFTTREESRSAS